MTLKEVTYYMVECDRDGCNRSTADGEYTAWGDASSAEEDWDTGDGQRTGDGEHFCWEHRLPECAHCGTLKALTIADDGEHYCQEHTESTAEVDVT